MIYEAELIPDLNLETKEEVFTWVANNIRYISDEEIHDSSDEWQLPHQTYFWRSGDCEDFAILAVYLLKRIGIEAQLEAGYIPGEKIGHAWVSVGGEHWESIIGMKDQGLPEIFYFLRITYSYDRMMRIARRRNID